MSEIIINAAEAMSLLKKHHFKGLKELLTTAPEIVRCRDCKHGELEIDGSYFCHWHGCDWNEGGHFCAHGERKDDGEID